MSDIANVSRHYEAVYTLLDDVMPFPVGDSEQPEQVPSLALYAVAGGFVEGDLGRPDSDLEMPFQVTCVSPSPSHARWMQNEVRQVLLSQELVVHARALLRITLEGPSGVLRDDQLGEREGQVFYTTDTFHVSTTPE